MACEQCTHSAFFPAARPCANFAYVKFRRYVWCIFLESLLICENPMRIDEQKLRGIFQPSYFPHWPQFPRLECELQFLLALTAPRAQPEALWLALTSVKYSALAAAQLTDSPNANCDLRNTRPTLTKVSSLCPQHPSASSSRIAETWKSC